MCISLLFKLTLIGVGKKIFFYQKNICFPILEPKQAMVDAVGRVWDEAQRQHDWASVWNSDEKKERAGEK